MITQKKMIIYQPLTKISMNQKKYPPKRKNYLVSKKPITPLALWTINLKGMKKKVGDTLQLIWKKTVMKNLKICFLWTKKITQMKKMKNYVQMSKIYMKTKFYLTNLKIILQFMELNTFILLLDFSLFCMKGY